MCCAVETFASSKLNALRDSLGCAVEMGLGSQTSRCRDARHAVLAIQRVPRDPQRLLRLCNEVFDGRSVAVHLITEVQGAAHALHIVERAQVGRSTVLLIMDLSLLNALLLMVQQQAMWQPFAYLVEYDHLPETLELSAQAHPHLTTFILQASDEPHAARNDASSLRGTPAAPGTDACGAPSALMNLALSVRAAQGLAYDELIDVSVLVRRTAAHTASEDAQHSSSPSDHASRSNSPAIRTLMIGDDLLTTCPRLHSLLTRKRVTLIETYTLTP